MSNPITVIGIDAALANMGLCRVQLSGSTVVAVDDLQLVVTESTASKTVRKSSSMVQRGRLLVNSLREYSVGANLAFAEIPSGAQSAAAAQALGIATGVICSCPVPVIEVSPRDVKLLFTSGKRSVPKAEVIEWAMGRWPAAPWIMTKRRGSLVPTKANEHLADAVAIVVAGTRTDQFKQLMSLNNGTSNADHHRPTSGRGRVLLV